MSFAGVQGTRDLFESNPIEEAGRPLMAANERRLDSATVAICDILFIFGK